MSARRIQRLVAVLGLAWAAMLCSAGASDQQGKTPAIDAKQIFMHECKDCHGEDGRGRMHGQPDFTNPKWQANVTDELMFKTIKFGREPMPFYFDALSDDQINALVKYIRSLAAKADDAAQKPAAQTASNACVACHQRSNDESGRLFAHSIHARRGLTCDACHGGDATAQDKQAAHAVNFVGKPSGVEQVALCGKCHTQPSSDFKTSLHFPKNLETPRVTCSDCHGAHTIGSASRDFSFSFAVFCTNCHGLEYLPELPADFRKLLQIADEENRTLARLRAWVAPTAEATPASRAAVRRLVGALVHKTDLRRAAELAPEIYRQHETFTKTFGAQPR